MTTTTSVDGFSAPTPQHQHDAPRRVLSWTIQFGHELQAQWSKHLQSRAVRKGSKSPVFRFVVPFWKYGAAMIVAAVRLTLPLENCRPKYCTPMHPNHSQAALRTSIRGASASCQRCRSLGRKKYLCNHRYCLKFSSWETCSVFPNVPMFILTCRRYVCAIGTAVPTFWFFQARTKWEAPTSSVLGFDGNVDSGWTRSRAMHVGQESGEALNSDCLTLASCTLLHNYITLVSRHCCLVEENRGT